MTFADLHEPSTEWAAARNIARALSAWQILDMNLVQRQGFMRIAGKLPQGLTGKLIDWKVLQPSRNGEGPVLVKGPRFDAVAAASREIAERQGAE